MLPMLAAIALGFVALALLRVGGARRRLLLQRWPAVIAGAAALLMALRGAYWAGLALAAFAVALWQWPAYLAEGRRSAGPQIDVGDAEARSILGVGPQATEAEIKAAYRAQMRRHHPDQGGAHDHAARLTAARDRLLKKR